MKRATKKQLDQHTKRFDKELGHSEGNCWCNCRVRGYRSWLGLKLYGPESTESMDDIDDSDDYKKKFDMKIKIG